MDSLISHQIQSKINKITNPKLIQEEETRNLRRVFSFKNQTLDKSQIHIFIKNGKWANDGLKMRSFMLQPIVLRLGEQECAHSALSFTAEKAFIKAKACFAIANQNVLAIQI